MDKISSTVQHLFFDRLPQIGDNITIYYDGYKDERIIVEYGILSRIRFPEDSFGLYLHTDKYPEGEWVSNLWRWRIN
jgi:hypothetical protein